MLLERYYQCAPQMLNMDQLDTEVIDNIYILQCIVTQDKLAQRSIVECLSIAYRSF